MARHSSVWVELCHCFSLCIPNTHVCMFAGISSSYYRLYMHKGTLLSHSLQTYLHDLCAASGLISTYRLPPPHLVHLETEARLPFLLKNSDTAVYTLPPHCSVYEKPFSACSPAVLMT